MKFIFMVALAALVYLLVILFNSKKTWIALAGGAIVLAFGLSAPDASWLSALKTGLLVHLNWNVMMIYVGSLLAAEIFIISGVPAKAAEAIAESAPTAGAAIALICLFTGLISAFVENVATVLVMAPIAIELAKKMRIKLSPVLILMAISSNLQGTATLIGDPPSMIFAGARGYGFLDFFFYRGRPSIFFFVETGALVAFLFTLWVFRRENDKPAFHLEKTVKGWTPLVLLVVMVVALALASTFLPQFHYATGIICVLTGLAGAIWFLLTGGKKKELGDIITALDWDSMAFLAGIFIVLGGLSSSGALEQLAKLLAPVADAGPLALFAVVVVLSVLVSGFVDNVPYIMLMLPVIAGLTEGRSPEHRVLVDFGLLLGACLGGNMTPFGASANVVAMGIAKKQGEAPTSATFMKLGVPLTLLTTVSAALVCYLVWKP